MWTEKLGIIMNQVAKWLPAGSILGVNGITSSAPEKWPPAQLR